MSVSGGEPRVLTDVNIGTPVTSSANQAAAAAAAAVATLPAVAGKTNYLTLCVLSIGQAAASVSVLCTITGIIGGTMSIVLTGGTTQGQEIDIPQFNPLQGAAANTAIVATIPSSGVSGPAIAVVLGGYYL
jgi:hypothetical protein